MERVLKWFFLLFVLPVLILFLIIWITFELTPQAKLRAMAAQEIGRRLNRQVEIGTVHLGITGLSVEELRLSEVPNFKAGPFVSAKGIHLGWAWRSLWEGMDFKKKTITRSSGSFHIDDFQNPHYRAKDFSLKWSLSGLDSTWSHVDGWAKLEQGPGVLENIDQLMAASPSAKVALTPVLAVMNLDRLGVLNLGLPDLHHWPIQGVHGDYTFENGKMTIQPLTITSSQLGMATTGTVTLGNGNLMLEVQLQSPRTTAIGRLDAKLRITGTTAHPKVDLDSLKKTAFRATLKGLLKDPQGAKKDIDQTLKNLFH